MYKVFLVNFGYYIYEGADLNVAVEKAVKSGFECVLTHSGENITYSPICGWRTL